jgi:hypothetical protein
MVEFDLFEKELSVFTSGKSTSPQENRFIAVGIGELQPFSGRLVPFVPIASAVANDLVGKRIVETTPAR